MNTLGKIEEAQFLLGKMKEHYNKNEFKFYFNSFLSASRSIIWVFKAEFNKDTTFVKWYNNYRLSDEEEKIFKRINDLRVQTTKIKPVKARRIVYSIIEISGDEDLERHRMNLGKQMTINISRVDEQGNQTLSFVNEFGETVIGSIADYRIVSKLNDSDDLYFMCERYLKILTRIFDEWLNLKQKGI